MPLDPGAEESNEGSIVMAQSDDSSLEPEPGEVDILLDAPAPAEAKGGAHGGSEGRPQVNLEYDEQFTRVFLAGEIDLAASAELDAAAAQATALGRPVDVDLSRVTFMDSIGVGFIARLIVAGQRAGWRPLLRGAQGPVLETLTVSGVVSAVDLTAT
jgi:anti-anti-sigma factor